jgi:hypothetical protein
MSPDRLGKQHSLDKVIINAQLPMFRVSTQRRPVRLSAGDRLADRALGQHVALLLAQPFPEHLYGTRNLRQTGPDA